MSFRFPIANLVLGELALLKRYNVSIPSDLDLDPDLLLSSVKDEAKWMEIYRRLTSLPDAPAWLFSPLNDTLETSLRGSTRVRISEMARRTGAVAARIHAPREEIHDGGSET